MKNPNFHRDYLFECKHNKASKVLFDYLIEPNDWSSNQFSLYFFVVGFFSSDKENRKKIVRGIERFCQVKQFESRVPKYLSNLVEAGVLNKELFFDILKIINDGKDVKEFDVKEFVDEVLAEDLTFILEPQKVYEKILD